MLCCIMFYGESLSVCACMCVYVRACSNREHRAEEEEKAGEILASFSKAGFENDEYICLLFSFGFVLLFALFFVVVELALTLQAIVSLRKNYYNNK